MNKKEEVILYLWEKDLFFFYTFYKKKYIKKSFTYHLSLIVDFFYSNYMFSYNRVFFSII